jgi:syntaxin-binding protein 1
MSKGADDSSKFMQEIVQGRFQEDVFDDVVKKAKGWMVLVTDSEATRVLSSVMTMYDVMENRISLVEKLEINRQPFKELDVVYIVAASEASVKLICRDFQDESSAKYSDVHIFFLEPVPQRIMGMLENCPVLIDRLTTLKEINVNFIAAEQSTFHFDSPHSLNAMYGAYPEVDHTDRMARQLASLCVTCQEHPSIRYLGTSKFAKEVATKLHQYISEYKRQSNTAMRGDHSSGKERGQILILDRSYDILTPLMHEYTYQTMANDLLSITDGIVEIAKEDAKGRKGNQKCLLNDQDNLWVELRHQHIAKVIETVKARLSDIIDNNKGASLAARNDMNISDMAAAVKALPEYRQIITKLSQHVNLAQQCMGAFSSEGLLELSQLEQTITTGVDEDGKQVKPSAFFPQLCNCLREMGLSSQMKIRLAAIYLISQKPSKQDRAQLISAAGLSDPEQEVLRSFERLGVSMETAKGPKATVFSGMFGSRQTTKYAATSEGEYTDTRHVGELRPLLDKLAAGQLPSSLYPALGPAAGGGGEVVESKRTRKGFVGSVDAGKRSATFKGGRVMIFVAGGLSYAEMRAAGEFQAESNRETLVGGSHLIAPRTFLKDVAALQPASTSVAKTF